MNADLEAPKNVTGCIFVVEDDPDVAKILTSTLSEFGFDPYRCRTAAELRRRLVDRVPDLCIVDLGLPDGDGMELVALLQQRYECGVLILTGRAFAVDRVMGLELGADDYMVKPFEPRELVARVRSILRRQRRYGASSSVGSRKTAEFSGMVFRADLNLLQFADGSEWTLSLGEAKVLMSFLQSPNRILSREQICGDPDLLPLDRSVDVRISRLRKKIEVDAQEPRVLRTVYGAGYLLAASVIWR